MLNKIEYWIQPQYAEIFSDSTAFHVYKMLKKIESTDMVSLLSCSVHAPQGDVCLCFADISLYERQKMI